MTGSDLENGEERDPPAEGELSADEKLEGRLATPLLQGQKGLDKAQVAISAFLIIVVGAVALSSGFSLPFQIDDIEGLLEVPALHRVATASEAWNGTTLRPFAALVLAAGWQVGSGSSTALHVLGIAVHLMASVLVFLLARRLLLREAPEVVAMSAGLLFALHPAVTQSVYYVSHMGSTLGALLMLLSIVLFLRATEDGERPRVLAWGLSLVAFALAWACDLAVWTLPVLLVAVDAVARKGVNIQSRILSFVPHTALLAILFVSHSAPAGAPEGSASHFYAQAATVADHFRTIFYPANLSLVHSPFDLANVGFPVMWLAFLAISIVLMWILPLPGLAAFWVAMAAAGPGLFGLDDSFREERVYLSLAGVACLLPWLVNQAPRPTLRTFAGVAAAALIGASGYFNYQRTKTWHRPPLLWSEARDECLDCVEPSRNLATMHINAGIQGMEVDRGLSMEDFLRAEELFQYVIDKDGETSELRVDLARARALLGNVDTAIEALTQALRLDPSNKEALLQMAILTEESAQQTRLAGDQRRALDFYENAARSASLSPPEAARYGSFLARLGEMGQSEFLLMAAAASDSTSAAAQTLEQVQPIVQSVVELETKIQARLEKDPDDPEILRMRINQKVMLGEHQKAVYLIDEFFEAYDPDLATWQLLAISKERIGAIRQFLDEWPDAPNPPEDASPWFDLAKRFAGLDKWEAAQLALERDAERVEGRPLPLVSLADMAMEADNIQPALTLLSRATQENPDSPEPWLKLVELSMSAGQRERAVQALRQAKAKGAGKAAVERLEEELGVLPTDAAPSSPRRIISQ